MTSRAGEQRDPDHRAEAPHAEAQRGRGVDRAPQIGIGDEPVGRRGREERRDQARRAAGQLEDSERARRSVAVAHLMLGDGERAVEGGRQRHDHGHDPPERDAWRR